MAPQTIKFLIFMAIMFFASYMMTRITIKRRWLTENGKGLDEE